MANNSGWLDTTHWVVELDADTGGIVRRECEPPIGERQARRSRSLRCPVRTRDRCTDDIRERCLDRPTTESRNESIMLGINDDERRAGRDAEGHRKEPMDAVELEVETPGLGQLVLTPVRGRGTRHTFRFSRNRAFL